MSKIPYEFRSDVDRWVRFHTLPGSKRYPATEDEYAIVLDRHNAVLTELGSVNGSVLLVTAGYTEHSKPAGDVRSDKTIAVHPGAFHWTSILLDPDPEPGSWIHLYISEVPCSRCALDTCSASSQTTRSAT